MRNLKILIVLSLLILLLSNTVLAGQDVKFQWDPYTTDPIVGFKLYMASTPSVTPTTVNLVATIPGQTITTYTQINAPAGIHYWILTAYQGTLESGPSNEVTYEVKLKPPKGLTQTITLTFTGHTTIKVANRK